MKTDENLKEEQFHFPYYGFSFREILAESWGRIHGVKGSILIAVIVTGVLSSTIGLFGYGLRFFLGEWGRNLYIAYALQFALNVFAYPFLAGVIMLGIRRAKNQSISFSMAFGYYTDRVLKLAVIYSATSYIIFALLLYKGIDHFLAQLSNLLLVPLFAFTAPLVIEKAINPFEAIHKVLEIFLRNWFKITVIYISLFCINFAGNFFLIGGIWTVPLIFIAHGVLYRHLIVSKSEERRIKTERSDIRFSLPASPKPSKKPALEGSSFQNLIAVVMIASILSFAGMRLYALHQAAKIYPPDNLAGNGNYICVHFNSTLYLLTPDGHMQQRVALSDLGIHREPADIELLEDNSILIGDQDKGIILRCDIENTSCNKLGPVGGYTINYNFKFIADEKRDLIYIADTNNHRLLVQDMQGNSINETDPVSNIDYPNDMAFDKNGLLWISNTLHNRIMSFEVKDSTLVETGESIKLDLLHSGISEMTQTVLKERDLGKITADLQGLKDSLDKLKRTKKKMKDIFLHTRPLALAWGDDDNVWIAASDPYLNNGGILVFDSEGKRINRIKLANKSIPVDMIRLGEEILVADTGLFRVYSLNTRSEYTDNFGDETFQKELSQAHGKLMMYQSMKKWAGRSLLILGIGVMILAVFAIRGKRLKQKSQELDHSGENKNGVPRID